jgi:hypothetical protein
MRVTTAESIKHYGTLADKALTEPLTITKNLTLSEAVSIAEGGMRLGQ